MILRNIYPLFIWQKCHHHLVKCRWNQNQRNPKSSLAFTAETVTSLWLPVPHPNSSKQKLTKYISKHFITLGITRHHLPWKVYRKKEKKKRREIEGEERKKGGWGWGGSLKCHENRLFVKRTTWLCQKWTKSSLCSWRALISCVISYLI